MKRGRVWRARLQQQHRDGRWATQRGPRSALLSRCAIWRIMVDLPTPLGPYTNTWLKPAGSRIARMSVVSTRWSKGCEMAKALKWVSRRWAAGDRGADSMRAFRRERGASISDTPQRPAGSPYPHARVVPRPPHRVSPQAGPRAWRTWGLGRIR